LHERLNQNSLFNKKFASRTFYLKNFNLLKKKNFYYFLLE
jgi:hypothetical protein